MPAPDDTAAPKWTPGPWRLSTGNIGNAIDGQSGRRLYDGDDGWRTVATYQACCTSQLHAEQEANMAANARLIAAAPSLYDALDHVEAVMSIIQPRGHTKEYLETLGEVRAALALARGETK